MSRTRPVRALRVGSSFVSLVSLAVGVAGGGGCLNREVERLEPRRTQGVVETLKSSRVEKIDLLLAIDNSKSMKDKQTLLGKAVPRLVGRLVNPRCVDPSKTDPVPPQDIPEPAGPTEACPVIDKGGVEVQTKREFEPVTDIHVGIVSSSLGDLAGGNCGGAQFPNDRGHLLDRTDIGTAQTFEDKHFLLWDPSGDYGPKTDVAVFQDTLSDMVLGVGQTGCGYEMQMESVVRFLVDPAPYEELVDEPNGDFAPLKKKSGVDQELLTQRKDFLRPDSLVAIVMLSDENDCSTKAEGQGYLAFGANGFDRAAAICETDPTNECCYSCSKKEPPAGCEPDPTCADKTPDFDSTNLRCWEQKRRFGVDTLYPVSRYTNAFTLDKIDLSKNDLAPESGAEAEDNPLVAGRPAGLVYFAGIVGVPWQAIARTNDEGQPDLKRGYKTVGELSDEGLFAILAGKPDQYIPPTDPFMLESVSERSGKSQILGLSPNDPSNEINGGDRTPSDSASYMNLQYACLFDVDDVEDGPDCEECAGDGPCENPACDGTLQTHAKALPGLRQLSLIESMGEQGVAASVCPAQTLDDKADDYGYNPAVGAIVDALKDDLRGQQCLPFSIEPDDKNQVSCLVLQTSRTSACTCDTPGTFTPPEDHQSAIDSIKVSSGYDPNETCFCEVAQLEGQPLETCQNQENVPADVDGWCYIDANFASPIGNPDLVQCAENDQSIVRVVGDPQPRSGVTLHIWCTGEENE